MSPKNLLDRDYREFYSGIVRLFILQKAAHAPIFGMWLIEHLAAYGYPIGPGTLYPILHSFERRGLLRSKIKREGRHARRMYWVTPSGRRALKNVKTHSQSLVNEIFR